MSPATACWPGRMWRARAPPPRPGSTPSRPGAGRRSPPCPRSPPPPWAAPLWGGRPPKEPFSPPGRPRARPPAWPPAAGATRPARALAAAAGRGGPVAVVTDGAIADVADLPSDLLARARVIVLPRPALFDAFVSDIAGPRRIGQGDTVRLRVSYGTTGKTAREGGTLKDARPGGGKGTLVVRLGSRRLTSRVVSIPDSGILSTEVTLPPSPFPGSLPAGWQALEVRLEGVAGDSEPRDDARWLVLEVSPPPSLVLLAAPADWDSRFLARTLSDVARVPVRTLVLSGSDRPGWRDAARLTPGSAADAG